MQAARRITYLGNDPSTLRSLTALLHARGYRLEAGDAGSLDRTDWYRLLIVDIDPRTADDMQPLISLRRQFPEHPIIVLCSTTAHPSTPLAHALRHGADDVVLKPLTNALPLLQAVASGWRLLDFWSQSPPEFIASRTELAARSPRTGTVEPGSAPRRNFALTAD